MYHDRDEAYDRFYVKKEPDVLTSAVASTLNGEYDDDVHLSIRKAGEEESFFVRYSNTQVYSGAFALAESYYADDHDIYDITRVELLDGTDISSCIASGSTNSYPAASQTCLLPPGETTVKVTVRLQRDLRFGEDDGRWDNDNFTINTKKNCSIQETPKGRIRMYFIDRPLQHNFSVETTLYDGNTPLFTGAVTDT